MRKQENLSAPRAKDHPPVCPADLWERLDAEVAARDQVPPAGSFTIADYGARYGKTYSVSTLQIEGLVRKGVIKEVGRFGSRHAHYYMVVDSNG